MKDNGKNYNEELHNFNSALNITRGMYESGEDM